ncbi:MAG: FtsQ-type POTRA domain-containing protein [Actinomycetes bacterium]
MKDQWKRLFNKGDELEALAPKKERTWDTKVSSSGKKRILISDDSDAPSSKASSVSQRHKTLDRTGVKRFDLRRLAIERVGGVRRLHWASMVGIAAVVVMLLLLMLTSPILSIRQVDVEGAVYTDPVRLAEVVDDLDGSAILTVDLGAAKKKLLEIPWVRQVRVSMHMPSRVTVEIVERDPVAFFRAVDGFNRVIDRDGRVLDVIEGDPTDFTPIIGTGPNLSAGSFVEQPFLGSAQLINALPYDLLKRLKSVSVTPTGEVSLSLSGDIEVLFGTPDDFQIKLVGIVNEMKRQGTNRYSVLDVSSGEPSVR